MKHIKTRIHTNTNAATAAQKIGGVRINELKKALQGDRRILKKLGSMAREGEMAQLLMPAIAEIIKTKVQNERDWNKFVAEYIDQGSKASLDITASQNRASLAEAKFVNTTKEVSEQFRIAWELEKGRHFHTIDYNRAKFFADYILQRIDANMRVLEQKSRIQLRQLDEDRRYDMEVAQHLLTYGDESNLDLIHKRDYVNNGSRSRKAWNWLRNVFGI